MWPLSTRTPLLQLAEANGPAVSKPWELREYQPDGHLSKSVLSSGPGIALLGHHIGADYDCSGGGGNGPYYTAPGVTYRVTGSDPYRLDANHDSYACG